MPCPTPPCCHHRRSYKYVTSNRRSLFGAVVLRAPPALRPLVYMGAHLALTLATMFLNLLWWRYRLANTIFLLCIFTASAWSGECVWRELRWV